MFSGPRQVYLPEALETWLYMWRSHTTDGAKRRRLTAWRSRREVAASLLSEG